MSGVVARQQGERRVAFLLGSAVHDAHVRTEPRRLFAGSKDRVRILLYALLFLSDVAIVSAAFFTAGVIRLGAPFAEQTLRTLAVIIPPFFAIAAHNGAYSVKALQRAGFGAAKVIEALAYSLAVAIALLFYMKVSVQFSRQIFAMGTVAAVLLVPVGRLVAGRYIARRHRGHFINRLVVVDDGDPGLAAPDGEVVISARALGLEDDDDPFLLDRLGKVLEGCDSVVISCSAAKRTKWCHALKSAAVDVEVMTPELDRFQALGIGEFNGHRTLLVSARPLNVRDRALKRALDLLIAVAALVVMAPAMALIAFAIFAESGGPVFFRQQRVGHNNRLFSLLKFRSFAAQCMDPSGQRSVGRGDERLTSVGRFIRRTSLDELPQLINVVAGHMSIVGPRPHALGSTAEDALFWEIDARYFHRHAVKPGMTGLAQVRGFRGATLHQRDLTNRLRSDLEYVSNWTIWRDLRIIVATFGVILHPNAF
jgi:lipopolysaccharide/colanic/teichoic acid biosynthesis glycosyltransferase